MNINLKSDSHQVAMDLVPHTYRATEDSGPLPTKRESVSDPRPNQSNHLNWEMFALWSFVAFSIAALFVAGYVIWAKCRGG
jgi:hypothetical protein